MTETATRAEDRALLLTPVVPDPSGVGLARRAWRWAAELAAAGPLEIVVVSTHPIPPHHHALPGTLRTIRVSPPAIAPRHLADWIDPNETLARTLVEPSLPPPRRILVFRLYLHDVAACLPPAWRERAEIDCDDWESATRFSLARIALRLGRWRVAWSNVRGALRYAAVEREVLSAYRTVHLSAREDAERLGRGIAGTTIAVTPNLVAPVDGLVPREPPAEGGTVLFVGTLDYLPNEDAVRWLGAAIAPRLRRLMPSVRIVVAGRAPEDLRKRMALDGIEHLSAPDDLREAYAAAGVAIAPLRGGGGTKLKVLEAWLHGRPIVATSHALRGLSAVPDRHALVADDADALAMACARVLRDPLLARRLAAEGAAHLRAVFLIPAP